jgi:hypothetical protein
MNPIFPIMSIRSTCSGILSLTLLPTLNYIRTFTVSSIVSSLRAHLPEGTSQQFHQIGTSFLEGMVLKLGEPIPRGFKPWNYSLPSIHSSDFFDSLENLIKLLHKDAF